MPSVIIQLDDAHLALLSRAGVAFKDVTERERHLKLTIDQLKCEIAGDSKRYYVIEREKYGYLARIAEAARRLPLAEWERTQPDHRASLSAMSDSLRSLGTLAPTRESAAASE
ncbi:MAG: hypothetical protein ACYDCK_10595 [Thermoplasmatota archaeon]